jgi:hypothetical protein
VDKGWKKGRSVISPVLTYRAWVRLLALFHLVPFLQLLQILLPLVHLLLHLSRLLHLVLCPLDSTRRRGERPNESGRQEDGDPSLPARDTNKGSLRAVGLIVAPHFCSEHI